MPVAAITGLGKTVLLIVAITFIAWALITAIFVPKRSPGFPRRLDAYIVVSAVLFLAQMSTVVWAAQTQHLAPALHPGGPFMDAHARRGSGGATAWLLRRRQPATVQFFGRASSQ